MTLLRHAIPLLFFFAHVALVADVKSTNGTIGFDVNSDNNKEALLNSTGLGIGVTSPSANLHIQGNAIISESISIGTQQSNSNLHLSGTLAMSFSTLSTNTEIGDHSYYFLDSSAGNLTITLPFAGNVDSRVLQFKKTSASHRVVIRNIASEGDYAYIMDESSSILPSLKLFSSNDQWHVISSTNISLGWTPNSINNLTFWIDAALPSSVTYNGANISQIDDQSGNDFHMTQGTLSSQPVFDTNKFIFNTPSNMFSADLSTAMSNISEYRAFVVAIENSRKTNSGFRFSPLTGATQNLINSHFPWSNGSIYFDLGNNTGANRLSANTGVAVGLKFMVQYVNSVTANEHALRITGNSSASNATTFSYSVGASPQIQLGSGSDTTFHEVILAGSYLSPADAEKVEGYLAWKWGLVDNLPSSHSYKNAPPY